MAVLWKVSLTFHHYFNAVGRPTKLRAGRYVFWIPAGKINFFFSETSRPTLAPLPQPPIHRVPESLPLEKQPGREIDESTPSATEVKNGWGCTFVPNISFHSVDGDNVIFTIITSILSKDTSDKIKHVKPPDTNVPIQRLTIHESRIGVTENQRSLVLPIRETWRERKSVVLEIDFQHRTQ